MQKGWVFRLSILLIMRLFMASALAMPGMNYAVDHEVHPVARDDLKKSSTHSSHHTVLVTATVTVTVRPEIDTPTSRPAVVSVTTTETTVKTTVVDTVTINSDTKHSSTAIDTSGASTDKQSGTVIMTGTTKASTDSAAATTTIDTTDMSSTTSLDVTAPSVIPFQHPTSTSSRSQVRSTENTMTTFATITAADSSFSATSTFNEAICDDIFCNGDGKKVCIYWVGYTSWDVSLGPMPGEQPTVIGTC
ncbi:hypothetical protein F4861DRAFT_351358 [Xylaria intraflava]|nr:hypothetical protein F4861DRAFT_351358 [Xylaria intraflava]